MILTHDQVKALSAAIRHDDQASFDQVVAHATTGQSNVDTILEVWKLAVDLDRTTMANVLSAHACSTAQADMWLHLVCTDRSDHRLAKQLLRTMRVDNLLHAVVYHDQPQWLAVLLNEPRIQRRPTPVSHALAHALREGRDACVRLLLPHVTRFNTDHMRPLAHQSDEIWNLVFPRVNDAKCLVSLASTLASRRPLREDRLDQCLAALPEADRASVWMEVALSAMDAGHLDLMDKAVGQVTADRWSPLLVSRAHLMKNTAALDRLWARVDVDAVHRHCTAARPVLWGMLDDLVTRLPEPVAHQWLHQHADRLPKGRAWWRAHHAKQTSLPGVRRPRGRP